MVTTNTTNNNRKSADSSDNNVEGASGSSCNNSSKNDGVDVVDAAECERILTPSENDVLSGRGGRINSHPGNVQFRQMVQSMKPEYLAKTTKKLDKAKYADCIVRQIRDRGGRFLKQHQQHYWVDIGDERARKKCGQALREDAPDLRHELQDDHNNNEEDDDDDDHEDDENVQDKKKTKHVPSPQRKSSSAESTSQQTIITPPLSYGQIATPPPHGASFTLAGHYTPPSRPGSFHQHPFRPLKTTEGRVIIPHSYSHPALSGRGGVRPSCVPPISGNSITKHNNNNIGGTNGDGSAFTPKESRHHHHPVEQKNSMIHEGSPAHYTYQTIPPAASFPPPRDDEQDPQQQQQSISRSYSLDHYGRQQQQQQQSMSFSDDGVHSEAKKLGYQRSHDPRRANSMSSLPKDEDGTLSSFRDCALPATSFRFSTEGRQRHPMPLLKESSSSSVSNMSPLDFRNPVIPADSEEHIRRRAAPLSAFTATAATTTSSSGPSWPTSPTPNPPLGSGTIVPTTTRSDLPDLHNIRQPRHDDARQHSNFYQSGVPPVRQQQQQSLHPSGTQSSRAVRTNNEIMTSSTTTNDGNHANNRLLRSRSFPTRRSEVWTCSSATMEEYDDTIHAALESGVYHVTGKNSSSGTCQSNVSSSSGAAAGRRACKKTKKGSNNNGDSGAIFPPSGRKSLKFSSSSTNNSDQNRTRTQSQTSAMSTTFSTAGLSAMTGISSTAGMSSMESRQPQPPPSLSSSSGSSWLNPYKRGMQSLVGDGSYSVLNNPWNSESSRSVLSDLSTEMLALDLADFRSSSNELY